ncbi:hypothetical protein M3J09_012099 [Ascochyta lentis]
MNTLLLAERPLRFLVSICNNAHSYCTSTHNRTLTGCHSAPSSVGFYLYGTSNLRRCETSEMDRIIATAVYLAQHARGKTKLEI